MIWEGRPKRQLLDQGSLLLFRLSLRFRVYGLGFSGFVGGGLRLRLAWTQSKRIMLFVCLFVFILFLGGVGG